MLGKFFLGKIISAALTPRPGIRTIVYLDIRKLENMQDNLELAVNRMLDKFVLDIEQTAKTLAPVDTGALRSSIYCSGLSGEYSKADDYESNRLAAIGRSMAKRGKIKFTQEVKAADHYERIVGASVVYAWPVEKSVKPFLWPAVQANAVNFKLACKGMMDDLVDMSS